jgi:hypothetical protein
MIEEDERGVSEREISLSMDDTYNSDGETSIVVVELSTLSEFEENQSTEDS